MDMHSLMNIPYGWLILAILGGFNLLTLVRPPKRVTHIYDSRSDSK
jgi:hypothetical protein